MLTFFFLIGRFMIFSGTRVNELLVSESLSISKRSLTNPEVDALTGVLSASIFELFSQGLSTFLRITEAADWLCLSLSSRNLMKFEVRAISLAKVFSCAMRWISVDVNK